MKELAVEWLIDRLNFEGFIGTYCSEEEIKSKKQLIIEIINQAKEMEKQQIIDAVSKGWDNHENGKVRWIAEQYYNEIIKQQEQ
jgi:hypothetical protein